MTAHAQVAQFQRQQFLNGECSQAQYYKQFITPAVIKLVEASSVFQHLATTAPTKRTDITLSGWEDIGTAVDARQLLNTLGDCWSLATSVVVNKAIAAHLLGIQS